MSSFTKLCGEIVNIIYKNEDNGYTVAELESDDTLETIVGYMPNITEGDMISAQGSYTSHSVYGEQFKVELYEKEIPKSKTAILKYLSSGVIKGIRGATAQKIVDRFGEESLEVIQNSPDELCKISGISQRRALEIRERYMQQQGASSLIMFLQGYNISVNMAAKIFKRFGTSAIDVIKQNPYILCSEIDRIGFKTADKIAMNMGKSTDDGDRIRAGVIYTLKTYTQFGHTYLPRNILAKLSCDLLLCDVEKAEEAITYLILNGFLISEEIDGCTAVYYSRHYNCENFVASKIVELADVWQTFDINDIETKLAQIERRDAIKYAHLQKEAIINSMLHGVVVITGGPGTGKTTIINTIIEIMNDFGLRVTLTAPTGRAAKRMSQVCNTDAKTIHRLLELGYNDDDILDPPFAFDEQKPLSTDAIIVDEMSMVDINLMNSLLSAVKSGTRLILVGDVNQLPSVGPGNVLSDIIESGCVKVVRLTEIFRQATKSMIVVNAHKINNGEYPIYNEKEKDFFFSQKNDAKDGLADILSLVNDRLPSTYNVSPLDIQVISPMKKGLCGTINLNKELQSALNPKDSSKTEKNFFDFALREGDKVIQTKNNYELSWKTKDERLMGKGVFNGDVGIVTKIVANTVTVCFDDRLVTYETKDLDELELAYAMTVHKSQGSEFPIVVIPMYDGPYMLINRNLFYTAITRAKKIIVLVGKEEVMRKMIDNNKQSKRYSGLKQKLIQKGQQICEGSF